MPFRNIPPEVLGEISLLQSMVMLFPEREKILEFACAGLEELSGIDSVSFAAESTPDEKDTVSVSATYRQKTIGAFLFTVSDTDAFETYLPVLQNFSNMIGVILEERRQRNQNEQFARELEERIQERTAELQQTREYIDTAANNLNGILYVLDTDLRFILSKGKKLSVMNLEQDEAVGIRLQKFLETTDLPHTILDKHRQALAGDDVELETQHGDTFLSTNLSPIRDQAGKITGVLGVSVDITEHKGLLREQRQLLEAIDQAGEAIIIADATPAIQYVNPAFESITGYSKEEVLGRNPRMLRKEVGDDELITQIWETITSGKTWTGRYKNQRKNGEIYHEETIITPVTDDDGKIINYIAVQRDVSEKVELENQLRQAQKMEAIGRLAGGVAHDFNNILTVIKGYADILSKEIVSSQQREMAEIIARMSERASGLTTQLLAFSRKQQLKSKDIIPDNLLKETIPMLSRVLGEDIELETDFSSRPYYINIDPGQLEQVIMNLSVNARDAMPQGGKLFLASHAVPVTALPKKLFPQDDPRSDNYYRLIVSDTGIGMDDSIQTQIFEPFFTTKGAGKGTGLGLSTVFGIVKQSGGYIDVKSMKGVGTTFMLYFPIIQPEKEDEQKPSAKKSVALDGTSILVLDDEPAIGKFVKQVLEHEGADVTIVTRGTDAIEAMKHSAPPFDLLLTDIVLPGKSGVEIATECSALHPDLKVMFMTGFTDDHTEEYLSTHDTIALRKPFSAEKILQVLHQALND